MYVTNYAFDSKAIVLTLNVRLLANTIKPIT